MGGLIAVWLPRILGVLAGTLATKIGEATGQVVDPGTLVGLGLASYAFIHRMTSKVVNPSDAATKPLAAVGVKANDTAKTASK